MKQTLLLDEQTVVSSARDDRLMGILQFAVESSGRRARTAGQRDTHWRRCRSRPGTTRTLLTAAHERSSIGGEELRKCLTA